ncbi:alpha/beta hydrolase fold [Saccharopolyspora kobensis]|uniref:Alpha/beta hydrolase fold n=1 Tax=Saccharopolyspora kobensis TaxID=146035 RepID=A0A1H5XRY2_9PSEU|nr:alpha/beta hydrolase [Saccharopolyspora kobensis]SEG14438.1 alpha/beta hydrolase fold [Saccharopolyspora kobensis]SFE38778.1 alpha/beta hydrolase fold [Saccharopolyspora kobensis]
MKRSFALGLAGAAVLASTAVTGVTAQAAPGLQFGPCPEDVSKHYPQLQCAELQVPLDHRDPGGEQLKLLVSKQPARKPEARRGVLLINPGGPGGPGVGFAGALAPKLPGAVLDSYDLIGFDTRNTAHSTPITCVDAATYWKAPLPDPDSPHAREQNWQRAQQYADGCQQRAGKYLPHLTTPSNARDMDRIREALGEERISYLGYSYGTYLGAVYGQLFPERVDRMLLDSVVNPDTSEIWYRNNLNQDVAAQHRLGMYFDWIARHDQVFHLGTERAQVQAAWDGVQAELRKAPRGQLGPAEFIDTTFNALYGESSWKDIAEGLADFRLRNDDKKLASLVKPKDEVAENGNAIYNAVECVDAPWPTRQREWERDSERLAADYPLAAWYNSWTVAPCRFWHAPAQQPLKITGAGLPPVLLINSEHDVATPYHGALEMRRSLPSSVLVTEKDAGKHGVWALAGNAEADRIGTDYLVNGVLPPEDVTLPGHPDPDPAAAPPASKTLDLP